MKFVTPQKAASVIRSGDHIYIHTAAAAPQVLVDAMTARHEELRGVEIYQLHTEGEAPYTDDAYSESFSINCFFIGPNLRKAVQRGRASYIPVFLSEVPLLFRKDIISLDISLISVSPPDRHGFCSLGVSIDATLAAIQKSRTVIAQVNSHMPRTHGEGLIHVSEIDYLVEGNLPIPAHEMAELTDAEIRIGKYISELIEDGATLQMGIGSIPNAVLAGLEHHKNLGVHSEMFSDGVIPLVEKGVINGKNKYRQVGKMVATFLLGSKKLYDFADDNSLVTMMDCAYVNNAHVIRRQPKMTAINSAIEIDLTGQVCADSIGKRMFSGVGGQMDFIRGAALSNGGKAVIALPSATRKGVSRIVSALKPGAGVVTTRAHVHHVVTEYGVAQLYGRSLRQRARALIEIAHPDHREDLERAAVEELNFGRTFLGGM